MKLRFLPLALITLIFSQYISAFSQGEEASPLKPAPTRTAILLGPVIGYNRAIHTANLSTFSGDALCPTFPNGNGNGFYAGFSFEYLLGSATSAKSSIIARVLYNSLPATFEETGDTYPSLVQVESSDDYSIVNTKTKHFLEVSYNLITLEVMYKLNLFDTEFGITAGPTFDFPISKTILQTYNLIEPDNVVFADSKNDTSKYNYTDGGRTMIVQGDESGKGKDIPEASGFRLGLKIGAQYEILLGRMYVVPAVYYNYGITKLTSSEEWNVHALQIGVDVRFSL